MSRVGRPQKILILLFSTQFANHVKDPRSGKRATIVPNYVVVIVVYRLFFNMNREG